MTDGVNPTNEYSQLLQQLDEEKRKREEGMSRSKKLDAAAKALDALTQFGTRNMQAQIQEAAPRVMQFRDPVSTYQPVKYEPTQPSVLQEAMQKAQVKKALAPKPAKVETKVVNKRIYEKVDGQWVPVTPEVDPGKSVAAFQQSDWVDEKTGQPVLVSKITGQRYIHNEKGDPVKFAGQVRRKIPKVLEDKEGRKYRLLQDGTKEYLTDEMTGQYKMWKDMTPEQQTYMNKLGKDYRTESRPIDDFESTIDGLDQFVAANLDGTIGAIKRQLARTVGQEKGVMTDKDVAAFGGTDKVISAIAQYAHASVHGGMTDEIQKNFQAILDVSKKNIARKRLKINQKYIRPAKFRLGEQASEAFIHDALGMKQQEKKQEKRAGKEAPYGDVVRRKGKTYKWNATKGKYQLLPQ